MEVAREDRRRTCDNAPMRRATLAAVSTVVLLALTAAKPRFGPGPAYDPGPIIDAKYGFAFDLPRGCTGEHAPDIPEYWIDPDSGLSSIYVTVETGLLVRCSRPHDAFDCLLAYASRNLALRCDFVGRGFSSTADSLLAPRRYRTRAGLPAVEYMIRVHEEFYGWGVDYKGEDSTAVIIEHSGTEHDSTSYCKVERIAGPEFMVDVGSFERPRFVRIEFTCSQRPDSTTLGLARSIAMSMRVAQ
jgi:hypothetical protein